MHEKKQLKPSRKAQPIIIDFGDDEPVPSRDELPITYENGYQGWHHKQVAANPLASAPVME